MVSLSNYPFLPKTEGDSAFHLEHGSWKEPFPPKYDYLKDFAFLSTALGGQKHGSAELLS